MTTAELVVVVEVCSHQMALLSLQVLMPPMKQVAVAVAVETAKVEVTPVVTVEMAKEAALMEVVVRAVATTEVVALALVEAPI